MPDLRQDVIKRAKALPGVLFDPDAFQQAILDLLDSVAALEASHGDDNPSN